MTVAELIEKTARTVVAEMRRAGLVKENRLGSFKKTEFALYQFYDWINNDTPLSQETKRFCELVNKAFDKIRKDPYFDIVPLKYGQRMTHEKIAEHFGVDVSVISKRRTKLINQLRPVIFSDDFIRELYEM